MTTKFVLTYPNGDVDTVEITTNSANDEAPVRISGNPRRLGILGKTSVPSLVALQLGHLAVSEGAKLEVSRDGQYHDENDVM